MGKKQVIFEVSDMSKTQLKALIKKVFNDEFKKKEKSLNILTKEDIRDIVKKMMIKQYKFFWEKKSFWVNNI